MQMPGMGEWVIILLIVLLVFGANKLPALGDGVGKAIKNFKRGVANVDDEVDVTPPQQQVSAESTATPAAPAAAAPAPAAVEQVADAEVIERKS